MAMTMLDVSHPPHAERFVWEAIYTDGAVVPEYDEGRPDGRGWAEVEHARVGQVLLHRLDGDAVGAAGAHVVSVPPGATPVFFRRRRILCNLSSGQTSDGGVIHCIGWREPEARGGAQDGGGGQASYLFLFEDGSTLLTHDLQAV